MPYFVYAVRPFAQLEPLGEFAVFKEASAQAKALRAAQPAGDKTRIRVMFAENALAAEDLLLQIREPGHPGEE
jgi:hypothetical protein